MNRSQKLDSPFHVPAEEYLHGLGKCLLWYFPFSQTREILSDYEEYFAAGLEKGASVEEMTEGLGTPQAVTAELCGENPQTKGFFVRHLAVWGGLLLLLFLFRYLWGGNLLLLLLGPVLLLCLFHGWGRAKLEGRYGSGALPGKGALVMHLFLFICVVLLEAGMQALLGNASLLSAFAGAARAGVLIDRILMLFLLLCGILFFWMAANMEKFSVLYLPGLVHILGGILFALAIRRLLHSMDLSATQEPETVVFLAFVCYLAGLLLSACLHIFLGRWVKREG